MIRSPFSILCLPVVLAGGLLMAVTASAAPPPADDEEAPASVSHPVVEPTAPSAGKALNAALGRLARDPRNADALLEAGDAALALGDNEAALGFFTRADQVSPNNPTVKAAIAGARLHLDDPVEALRWYAEAQRAGADPVTFALDRGLAYDLVGDNAAAIEQYRTVLARGGDGAMHDEAVRRQAISLAIGGDRRGADRALLPLLQRQDRAAWRAHVFVLAIAGRSEEAIGVMRATMPAELAAAIGPYLRFMGQLTPAQQAAVVSQGRFPRAAEIGRDNPRVAAYAAAHPRVPLVPAVALTPALARASAAAQAQAAFAAGANARSSSARHRKGHDAGTTVAAAAPTLAAVEPDIVLPPPPPPPTALAAALPPGAPVASRTTTPTPRPTSVPTRSGFDLAQTTGTNAQTSPTVAAVVPRPTVLSRLDMPPPPRPSVAVRTTLVAAAPATTQPGTAAATTTGVVTPFAEPTPVAPALIAQPVVQPVPLVAPPQPYFPPPVPTPPATTPSHAVVQPIPDQPVSAKVEPAKVEPMKAEPVKVAPVKVEPAKAARIKPAPEKLAAVDASADKATHDKPAKGKDTHAKSGKDKPVDPADDEKLTGKEKAAKAKLAHGKSAKDDDAAAALVPCKPVATGKGRKSRAAAAKEDRSRAATTKSRRHGKGKPEAADSDTCAPAAKGDRPDGPAGVSRDGEGDDTGRPAKGKSKSDSKGADAKGKGKDKSADRESEKSGKHARYASRIWVEVLTGGDRDKMPGEWRSLVRKAHKLKGRKPYITPWRSNFRLLTGPFDSDADAQDFIAELRKDGVSGFEWTSPAGQAVDSLALP